MRLVNNLLINTDEQENLQAIDEQLLVNLEAVNTLIVTELYQIMRSGGAFTIGELAPQRLYLGLEELLVAYPRLAVR